MAINECGGGALRARIEFVEVAATQNAQSVSTASPSSPQLIVDSNTITNTVVIKKITVVVTGPLHPVSEQRLQEAKAMILHSPKP